MQKKYLYPVLLLVLIICYLACKKSDSVPTPPPQTRVDLIGLATWKFSNAKVSGVDVSAYLQNCQKDNLLRFYNGFIKTGNVNEGPLKCNLADPQVYDIWWQLPYVDTLVINSSYILFTGGSNTFSIVSVSETAMVLSQVMTISGTPQMAVITFVH